MKVSKVHAAVVAALAGGVGSFPFETAFAQGVLEEVVVTATRRAQDLQHVPISIVAITGENLELRGMDNLEKLSQGVPNVLITGGGGGTGGTRFRMRGIPDVGTYIDGVLQGSSSGPGFGGLLTQEFVDIDRIEVLRGPQGTTFGRDSTGGALRIWTKRPAEEFGGTVSATVGSLDRRDVRASLDLPFSENLRSKWTGASFSRDGYIRSLTTGENGGYIDQQVFRGDIVWDATPKLDFRFNYQKDVSELTEPRVQDAMFQTWDQTPSFGWAPDWVGMAQFYTLVGTDFRGNPVEPFFNSVNQVAGFPGGKVGKWENRSGTTLPNRYDTRQTTVEINWRLSDNMTLQFLTANTKQDSDSVVDWDNSQYDLVLDMNRSRFDVFSEEIQLTGGNNRVDWLAGVYYWEQKVKSRNGRWQLNEFQKGIFPVDNVLSSDACNPPGGVPAGYATCLQVWNRAVTGSFDNMSRTGQEGWAVFGEATIHLTDTWDLTLGFRQHEQTNTSQTRRATAGTPAKPVDPTQYHVGDPFVSEAAGPVSEFKFDELTTRLAVQKQFTGNIMGYFGYSEGFRPGGVAAPVIDGVRTEIPFAPSFLENTEIGMRSDLANGKVRFNWTLFQTVWKDLQANSVVIHPTTGEQLPQLMTKNVGEAEAKGIEFELTFLPVDRLMINVGLGLLDTEYTKVLPGTYSGHILIAPGVTEFEQAPDKTYTIGLQHTATLGNGGTFISRADYNYQGQFWRDAPFLRVSGYDAVPANFDEAGDWGVLNMRFVYEPANANWTASVFGTNLTDKYMLNSGFFHGIWGFDFATVGRPREVGAALTFRF